MSRAKCLRVFPLLNSAAETVGMHVSLEVSPRDHPVGRVSHHMLRLVLLGLCPLVQFSLWLIPVTRAPVGYNVPPAVRPSKYTCAQTQ